MYLNALIVIFVPLCVIRGNVPDVIKCGGKKFMSLEERVIAIIQKNLEKTVVIKLESDLIVDLQIDSLGKIMIIAALEDEFAIEIDEAKFVNIKTVADIVKQLRENCPESPLERKEE